MFDTGKNSFSYLNSDTHKFLIWKGHHLIGEIGNVIGNLKVNVLGINMAIRNNRMRREHRRAKRLRKYGSYTEHK